MIGVGVTGWNCLCRPIVGKSQRRTAFVAVLLGSVRKVLWERACPAMECEALLYPISNSVKDAANSGFAAASRQIAGQVALAHRRSHNVE